MSVSLYHAQSQALRALLRDMRLKAKLTQTQMAEVLSVGQSYVSKVGRGENFVDVMLFPAGVQLAESRQDGLWMIY